MSHDIPSFEDEHKAGLHWQYPHAACLLCVDEESQKKTNAAFESLTKRISELEEIVSLLEQDAILDLVRRRADGRPVRWVDKKTSAGDFDGRDWTIEVFDVAKGDRLALREKLWDLFNAVRKHTGKPMSLVTHTPEDTNSFYAWVRSEPNRDTALPGVPRGTPPRAIGRDLRTTPRR